MGDEQVHPVSVADLEGRRSRNLLKRPVNV
jgi:hypothetical protein